MTPRQMVAFGELYVNGGRVGDRQLIPQAWVEKTEDGARPIAVGQRSRVRLRLLDSRVRRTRSRIYAWGYGGQFIFVVPELDLVVVTTSRSDVCRERRDHSTRSTTWLKP